MAAVSSNHAPMTTRVPETADAVPNRSLNAGLGLLSMAVGTVGVALARSYTYALPASVALVSSNQAPTTTRVPEMATEKPNWSPSPGFGLLSVAAGTVGVALARS